MEDMWKFILYALAVGLYYFIKGRKKPEEKPQPAAKPFMSPAASQEAKSRPVASPPTTEAPTSLEDLLRRLTTNPSPQPMLEDKVRLSNQKRKERSSEEGRSLEVAPDIRSLEGPGYDQQIPYYRNEANEVNYEIPEKAAYKGLNDNTKSRFKEFETHTDTESPYAKLLQNPANVRNAFVLSEIFKRKEW